MKTLKQYLLMLLTVAFLFSACSKDDDDDDNKIGEKEAILLVTFGSSYPEPQNTFEKMDTQIKAKFEGAEVRWAYTSHIIRNILLGRLNKGEEGGKDVDSPEEALKKIKEEGYSKLTVQSLHVIPGAEYNDLKETVVEFLKNNEGMKIEIGSPLMNEDADMETLAISLVESFKVQKDAGEAVAFMGHGTHHAANARYARFQTIISKTAPNFFIGTVEAKPDLADVIKMMESNNLKTVTLTPLMSIAGDHANNDMAGDYDAEASAEEQSWKYQLEQKGYTVKIVLKGLGDYQDITSIWANHLEEAKAKL